MRRRSAPAAEVQSQLVPKDLQVSTEKGRPGRLYEDIGERLAVLPTPSRGVRLALTEKALWCHRYSLGIERSIFIKGMPNRMRTAISTPTLNQTRR